MKRKVVMTGTVGVMTEANLKVMKDLLERRWMRNLSSSLTCPRTTTP